MRPRPSNPPAPRRLWALLSLLGLGCGVPSPHGTWAPWATVSPVWGSIGPGEYRARGLAVPLEGAPAGTTATWIGARPLRLPARARREPSAGPETTPAFSPPPDVLTCVSTPVALQAGDAFVAIPAGGEVRLVAEQGDLVRVAAPWRTFYEATHVLPRDRIGAICEMPDRSVRADRRVPPRHPLSRACLFADRPGHGTPPHVVLPAGTAIEVQRSDGHWIEARAVVGGAFVSGWVHAATLVASPAPDGAESVRTTGEARVGRIEIPSGTRALAYDPDCRSEGCDRRRRLLMRVATPEGEVEVRALAETIATTPDAEAAPLVDEGEPPACFYPDTPEALGGIGTLRRRQIRAAITSQIGGVRRCYERRLTNHPRLAGRLVTYIVFGPTGRVADVRTDAFDPFVGECVRGVLHRVRAPPTEGAGLVAARYPFVLTSSP